MISIHILDFHLLRLLHILVYNLQISGDLVFEII